MEPAFCLINCTLSTSNKLRDEADEYGRRVL